MLQRYNEKVQIDGEALISKIRLVISENVAIGS